MSKSRPASARVSAHALANEIAPDGPSPGLTLLGLSCVVVELADALLARNDLEKSRSLVELSMSILCTATEMDGYLEHTASTARTQLDLAMRRLQARDRPASDPDDEWPYHTV